MARVPAPSKRRAAEKIVAGEEYGELNDAQRQAIRLLVGGTKKVDVAHEVGVTPETISRCHRDPLFVAELNQAHQDAYGEVITKLHLASSKAVDVLLRELDQGNLWAVEQTIKMIARLQPPAGPTTPARVKLQQLQEEPGELEMMMASM